MPGVVDTHVHVNEPGRTEWEGFETATRAAAAGGVTTILDMPLNSIPATTSVEALVAKQRSAAGQSHVNVEFIGGVVPGNASQLEPLARAGVRAFKCFLTPSGVDDFSHVEEQDLREAFPILAQLGLPLMVHAEDPARILAGAGRRIALVRDVPRVAAARGRTRGDRNDDCSDGLVSCAGSHRSSVVGVLAWSHSRRARTRAADHRRKPARTI